MMSYLDTLTRSQQSPIIDYHAFLFSYSKKTQNRLYDGFFDTHTVSDILADIKALELELTDFEKRFKQRSQDIYTAYQQGIEPEDDNFVLNFGEWAAVYEMWLECQAEYRHELDKLLHQLPEHSSYI